jgi:hypothetical protein
MKRFLLLLALAGCTDPLSTVDPPDGAQSARIMPGLKAMAFATATSGSGHSLFDNHVPCVRRGVITYSDDEAGRRQVAFHGCYIAPGVSASGQGRLLPAGSAWRWEGPIQITLDDTLIVGVDTFSVAAVDAVVLAALQDTSGLTLNTIANASGSLDALSNADLNRIAHHLAMVLGSFQLDETLEAARGNHTHTFSFGTSVVTIDPNLLPHLANAWTAANLGGVIVDGAFTMEWGRFETSGNNLNAMRLDLSGDFRLGGGLPRVDLTGMRWLVTGTGGGFPADISITLELTGPAGSRTFQATVRVDD